MTDQLLTKTNIDELLNYPIELSDNRILIVDDSPYLLAAMLRKYGYDVETVTDSQDAVRSVVDLNPDLILLDIMMPGMDGYEVCGHLKASAQTREIPVIFISARNEAIDKIKAFQVGGSDYISKQFQFAEVLVRVENQLNQRRLQKQLQASEAKAREKSNLLARALQQVQQTQSQLVQQAKLSSLGQLVAGVAHEINNPINFVYGNLTYLAEYTDNLLNLIQLYNEALPVPTPEIETAVEEIDLDFIQSDLPRLVESMRVGTERIQQIVRSLRNYSHLDKAEVKAVNLQEGIDNTLTILQHRLKAKGDLAAVEIVKSYGELPEVECHAGQVNQVFTNILSNAVDALEERRRLSQTSQLHAVPTISIETGVAEGDRVYISISDNGSGMSESVRQRIFDPFFTTKDIGVGTGLGMSISYQIIVERHGGEIRCHSVPGKGTTFTIEIPIKALYHGMPSPPEMALQPAC
ncbi:hybrid sensor histidine kinase/response regulator [Baaleninema sp.]|uniref:hybrid sensor histidine kinase/response regulator n=1 Tax=Baaleninema sp. TaxID=3101197 RepID=UPI003D0029F8